MFLWRCEKCPHLFAFVKVKEGDLVEGRAGSGLTKRELGLRKRRWECMGRATGAL